ncbi:biotin--[acetyl-CoA-carboxylase] ligase [Croceicoccus bisphenolivorans]|uniref:biotin--[acetyl-CoA-carboxylase] ligase n=1 Tax=Croceicoccus bisphenolivorans TaxID=1783232 RepID=UPI0008310621|nr:biotin--[acetyl-CoA-carboxylase] ligase [Croceicoccus bisphenolivorans]
MTGGQRIECVEQIGSTNGELVRRLASGEAVAEGAWLVADRQTDGRGRLGRVWSDGAGNFMGSTAVRLRSGDPLPQTLALVAGVALYEAISRFIGGAQGLLLKWPNDVLLDGGKLAGILLERAGDVVVIGVGANLSIAPDVPDRRTASLASRKARVDRDDFAEELAKRMATELATWRKAGLAEVISRWTIRGPHIGASIRVVGVTDTVSVGSFAGLDSEGALLMRMDDGTMRAVHAGEVLLLREEGA